MNIIINAQYNIHVVQDTIQKSHNKKEKMWLISKKKKKKNRFQPWDDPDGVIIQQYP